MEKRMQFAKTVQTSGAILNVLADNNNNKVQLRQKMVAIQSECSRQSFRLKDVSHLAMNIFRNGLKGIGS